MKIAILTEIINFHSGSRAPLEIARHLALLGNDVTVYAYSDMLDQRAKKSLILDKVKIKLVQKSNNRFLAKQLAAKTLYKLLKKDSPDIATFSGTPPFFIAAKLAGIPVVRIYQGVQFDAFLENKLPHETPNFLESLVNKLANIVIFAIDLMSFRLSNGVVSISKYAAQEGENLYRRKSDSVIYHGTTPLQNPKKTAKKDQTSINFVSVSRITPYKGFHKIINALNKVSPSKKIKLTIVGSQPKKKYVKFLKQLGRDKLTIVTNTTDAKLAKIYKNSDIYVCADRYLYFGLPICEAANFGLPAVSFNFAAASELIIHGKTGYVARDQTEFANYLKKLIYEPKLRVEMGKKARKRAQEFFSWPKAAKQYEKLFYKLIEQKNL